LESKVFISGLSRTAMRLYPQYFRSTPSLFHLFSLSRSRMYSSDNSQKRGINKIDFRKEHSVVVPLGSQEVCVPSEKQRTLWKNKMAMLDRYADLYPDSKKIELMTLSIQKFSHFMETPVPRVEDEGDLNQIFSWVSSEAAQKKVAPKEIYHPSGKLDVISSIITTINKYFADIDFSSSVRIQSVSEYFWYSNQNSDYIYPLIADSDELHTIVEMGLPFLDHSTLYHEVGVGAGEGVIEVIRRGVQEDRVPGCIVGTDLNRYSLESIRILIEEGFGGLDNVFLRCSNAADPIDNLQLGFVPNVVVVAANRFFSILDPDVFDSVVGNFSRQMNEKGYLVSGISLSSPENLERPKMLIEMDPDKYCLEEIDLGTVWYQKDPFKKLMEKEGYSEQDLINMIHKATGLSKSSIDISKTVMQVYYQPERFIEKIEQHSLKLSERKMVKEYSGREVMLFKKS